ncbi:MAG: cupin domain-containing protein [Acidobacteriota bacterium]
MTVELEGGCLVTTIDAGEAITQGNVKIRHQVGHHTGAQAISLRVLEFGEGLSKGIRNPDCDAVQYVLAGSGKLFVAGQAYDLEPDMGIYIKPEETFAIENPNREALVLISCECPEPQTPSAFVEWRAAPHSQTDKPRRCVRLADRKAQSTADRWYRVLIDTEVGSQQVTQFVGSIPPGRAPDHFHTYEEVIVILRGTGRMWAGKTHTPIAQGSCIFLPKKQVHCLENTGDGELRLLGIFYPAGSPAVRYDAK